MIKLTKGQCPPVLAAHAAAWTAVILAAIADNRKPTKAQSGRYNEATIKAALILETHGKCAYCESKILHVAPGDIEHITPKNRDPNHWFDWDNLTLACDWCNTNKGEHMDVLDPYVDDPAQAIWFLGALVFAAPGSDLGKLTETRLKLNREQLLERRTERLKAVMMLLEQIRRVQNLALRETLQRDFLEEAAADKEYAAMVREVVRHAKEKGVLPP